MAFAPPSYSKEITLNEFIQSIPLWEVPEGADKYIKGDGGKSVGYWQISQPMVDDYIRISKDKITLQDCYHQEVATKVARCVFSHYIKHIRKSGEAVQIDHLLFIWNGGGSAWRRVHYPKNDQKQLNLERYRERAYRKLGIYEKKKT